MIRLAVFLRQLGFERLPKWLIKKWLEHVSSGDVQVTSFEIAAPEKEGPPFIKVTREK